MFIAITYGILQYNTDSLQYPVISNVFLLIEAKSFFRMLFRVCVELLLQ